MAWTKADEITVAKAGVETQDRGATVGVIIIVNADDVMIRRVAKADTGGAAQYRSRVM